MKVNAFVVSGLSQKAVGKGRKFGKNEFVQALLGQMFPDISTTEIDCHSKRFVDEINDRLNRDPKYRERFPKGAKVSNMTIARAWRELRAANTRHLNQEPTGRINK